MNYFPLGRTAGLAYYCEYHALYKHLVNGTNLTISAKQEAGVKHWVDAFWARRRLKGSYVFISLANKE